MLKFGQLLIGYTHLYLFKIQYLPLIQRSSLKLLKISKKTNKYKYFRKSKKTASAQMDTKTNSTSNATAVPAQTLDDKNPNDSCRTTANLIPNQLSSPKKLSYNRTSTDYRHWEDTDLGSEIKNISTYHKNGKIFTLMSYNILAQDLLEEHPYLYTQHNPDSLKWQYRLARLRQEILIIRPEILCLQEVQQNHLNIILDALKHLEYDHVYKKKTGSRSDGCAIFFNKNIFTLMERHSVEYYQPKIERLNRENVAVIVKLCLKSSPSTCFIVSTTHLLYNPRRQDVRLAQIQVLLAELDRVSISGIFLNDKPQRIPIILTGDFNLPPHSAPYRLVTTGKLYYYNLTSPLMEEPTDNYTQPIGKEFLTPNLGITDNCQHFDIVSNKYQGRSRLKNTEKDGTFYEKVEDLPYDDLPAGENANTFSSGKLTHNLNLSSVYNHRTSSGEKEATTFQGKWITVDYIFYTRHFSPSVNSVTDVNLKLLSQYKLPTVDQCHRIGKIPNLSLGSDHLSLAAQFFIHSPESC